MMKKISKNIGLLLLTLIFTMACSEDDRSTDFVNEVSEPSDLALAVAVSTDNSGLVSFAASGNSVVTFDIDFGDGSNALTIAPGENITHTYLEGEYVVTLTGTNSIGASSTVTQNVAVTFLPPENLTAEVTISETNVFLVEVDPEADNASGFQVYFGDVADETPTVIGLEDIATHIYADIGTYEIRIVAFNGGQATIEITQMVTIVPPGVILPIDFENSELDYGVFGFEGADSEVLPNEVAGGINTSTTVVRSIKTVGAQFFAGTIVPLEAPIDFSSTQSIRMKTYSPKANIPIRLKLETEDGSQFVELDVNTTVTDQWETLVWDFSSMNTSNDFVRIVVFFEFVPSLSGDGSTYYFDDIELAN